VLLTIIWWERGRIGERDLMPLIPLAVLALIWTGITIYTQTRAWSTRGANIQILAAGRVVCTYFWHLIWPVNLAFAYPKWAAESAIFDALMAVAIAVVLAGAWMLRRRAGRGPVAGILLFLVALLPALIFRSDVESSSHVADHLAYLAAMALIVGIVSIIPRTPLSWGMWPGRIAVGAICILLAVASIGHINDYQSSQNLWNAALRADPGSATAHNYLGVMELEQNHDLIAAMEHFEAASQRDPEDARTKIYMGRVYEKKSEIGKALMRYQEAARLAPEDPDTHFALAGAMELQGDSDGAIREYERALELRPDDVMANNNLGLLHFERGEVTQATARLQHAIEINPSFFPAYMNLANIFFDWGFATLDQAKITRSAQLLEQAEKIAVDPQTKSVVKAHAAVYSRKLALRQGAGDAEREEQMARSESLLRQAIVLNPAFPEAQWELGRTLLLRGKTDEAIARLEKAVKMDQNDERFVRSLRAAREGNLTEALN
jgi:tetratricopeptide (TPR) repeat protein